MSFSGLSMYAHEDVCVCAPPHTHTKQTGPDYAEVQQFPGGAGVGSILSSSGVLKVTFANRHQTRPFW